MTQSGQFYSTQLLPCSQKVITIPKQAAFTVGRVLPSNVIKLLVVRQERE
jgi:hypothetical protein